MLSCCLVLQPSVEPEGVDGWTEMRDFFQSSFFFRFVQCHVSDQLNLAERQSRKPEHDSLRSGVGGVGDSQRRHEADAAVTQIGSRILVESYCSELPELLCSGLFERVDPPTDH